ncbi:MAG: PLP-dependent transferase [Oscillospiraceae bacterium]|jgi:arginine/lysine/ornithine decarboxylase|nr:PLP-dependent transferase [Oscillospiraceae bacterium]
MNTPVHDFLESYAASNPERCHMPGNKGVSHPFDITEIAGAVEIIGESERNAAELFGAKRTLYSCSGATLAVFAMLSFCANRRVTAFRNSHRSLIDAAVLLGFEIDWVYPQDDLNVRVNRETAAVFVTNIDCYGQTRDIKAIFEVCREKNVPLLADNAHGAYLVFTDAHPLKLGAYMTADSAHKTLPALTGAAYLHISNGADARRAEFAEKGFALFGTSSPSYLILDSLDLCNIHIFDEKKRAETAFKAVASLKAELTGFGYSLAKTDALRVTVDANAYGYTGGDFSKALENRGVICEMFDDRRVVLLFSTVTEEKNALRVLTAMRGVPQKNAIVPDGEPAVISRAVMPPREAFFSRAKKVPLSEAAGRVCGEIIAPAPPGVPLVAPGETVTDETVELLKKHGIYGLKLVDQH